MNGLPYYKRYPRDFIEGTIGLPFEVKAAYAIVLDLIYLQGGKLPDDPGYISGVLGCSKRKWSSLRDALIQAKKLTAEGGLLTNYRAVIEVEKSRKLQDKMRENASAPRKNNDLEKPKQSHTDTDTDITLDTDVSKGADAPDFPSPIDATKEAIWRRGVPFLTERGVPERQARSFIGKCIADHGAQALFDALAEAKREGTGDPIPFIVKVLEPPPAVDVRGMMKEIAAEMKMEEALKAQKRPTLAEDMVEQYRGQQ